MTKIPFDIKYRPQIEAGKYKVVTDSGAEVKIVCWDADEYWPIVGIVNHSAVSYRANGSLPSKSSDFLTLFLITTEPELSEDERIRKDIVAAVEMRGDLTQGRKSEIYAYLEKQKESLHISETCKENVDSFISLVEAVEGYVCPKKGDKYVSRTEVLAKCNELKKLLGI